jgi:DHA2 family methylenomycin A resistance protein-like MFS transporter
MHTSSTTARMQRLTLIATCLAVLMVQIDTTVVNLALHAIQIGLGGGVTVLQWVVDAYNVVYASLILTGGALGDLFGRRRWFSIGIATFCVGSLVCGLAPAPQILIGGRALAGVGAALALPGSLAVLSVAYPDARQRARAVSIWAGVNGVAIALGPVLGGVLVDRFGWRSIFFVVVPLTLLTLVLTRWLAESADPAGQHLDLPGQALAIVGLGVLATSAIEGQSLGWFSPPIVGCLLGSVLALGAFVAVERRTAYPLVPLNVFGNRALTGSLGVAAAMTFGMYGMLFLVPLFLQSVLNQTATAAGILLIPMGLTFAVSSVVSGRLSSTSVGPRLLIGGGMALSALGLTDLSGLSPASVSLQFIAAMLMLGLALGLQTGPLMAVAVANAPAGRTGMASGLINVARMLGATLGVAVLGSIFAVTSHGAQTSQQFMDGMRAALVVGALVEFVGCLIALGTIGSNALRTSPARRLPRRGYA